jgi:hypothetical protein
VYFFGMAFLFLFIFSLGALLEIRLLPDLERRREILLSGAIHSFIMLITATHFWFSWILAGPPFVKWYLLVSGTYLLINESLGITKLVRKVILDKKSGNSLPRFRGNPARPDLTTIATAIHLPFGCYAGAALLIQLRTASQSGMGWLLPLQAASQLTILLATVCFLGFRAMESASKEIYRQLERDILLDNLSAEEIKRRFILQSLGPSLSDWFTGLAKELEEATKKVRRTREDAVCRIQEIEAINKAYALERAGRAKAVGDNICKTASEYNSKFKSIKTRFHTFSKYRFSLDKELLKSTAAQFLAQLDRDSGELESMTSLLDKVNHLVDGDAADSPSPK